MAVTTQSTGASQLWANPASSYGGITGRGITVVVIDSGIAAHSDLDRRVLTWIDYVDPAATTRVDTYGHGTHVAGIIAGSGAGSRGADGRRVHRHGAGHEPHQHSRARHRRIGAASRMSSRASSGRSPTRTSSTSAPSTSRSAILRTSLYKDDPLAKAVERAVASGIVVILLGGQPRQDGRRHADRGRHRFAGRHAWGVDGRIAQHARHGRAQRRWRDDVQLARTGGRSGSAVDVGAQAGCGCAGQRDCVGRSAGQLSLGQLSVATCAWCERRDVHDAVGIEHGGGGASRARSRRFFRPIRSSRRRK